jgi:hypothetical protein
MTDILIRGVPDEVVDSIDINARRVGLSRTEYLRRALMREKANVSVSVDLTDLVDFAETFQDLANDEVMSGAWS